MIRFDSAFTIWSIFSNLIRFRFSNSIWLLLHAFIFKFEPQHTSHSWFTNMWVPHRLEFPNRTIESEILEYFEILKTQIPFFKDTPIFWTKKSILFPVYHKYLLKITPNSNHLPIYSTHLEAVKNTTINIFSTPIESMFIVQLSNSVNPRNTKVHWENPLIFSFSITIKIHPWLK